MVMGIYHFYQNKDLNENLDLEQQKKNISVFLKKQICTENLVIFIGSGCSVPDIPLMSKTMKEIIDSEPTIKDVIKEFLRTKSLGYIIEMIKEKKDEHFKDLLECIEQEETESSGCLNDFLEDLSKENCAKDNKLWQLLEEFYDSYTDIESLFNWLQNGIKFNPSNQAIADALKMLKEKFVEKIPVLGDECYKGSTFRNYRDFYKYIFQGKSELKPKISIFTTNYDLFNEHGLEANHISYTTGFSHTLNRKFDINQFKYRVVDDTNRYKDKWQPVFKEANLYKIHGSINWVTRDGKYLYQIDSNEDSEKVIIYPTVLKHMETAQSPYSELFREFANCLQKKNTTLMVIGYGFPDEHINNIISQNLSNHDFNLIVFGNQDESKINAFYKNFKESNLHLIGGKIGDNYYAHYFSAIVKEFLAYDENLEDSEEEEA